jgi:hypothetical protein
MLRPKKGMMTGRSMVLPPSDLVQNPVVAPIPPKTPTKRAPVKQAPIKRAPIKQAPIKQAPVKQAPVKQAPIKQAPVKQAPIKQAPILTPAIGRPQVPTSQLPEIINLPRPEDNDAGNATIDQGFDPNDPLNQTVDFLTDEPAPAPAPEPETEMTFTFFKGAEEGKGNPNYLFEQRGRNDKATVEDLEEYFNAKKSNRLRESFGDFDNYLAYMTEREQLIQSGDYDVGNWAEADAGFNEDQQMIFEGDADLTIDPSDPGQNLQNLQKQQTGAQSGAYNNWLNSETNQALLEKYGVNPEIYSDSGDKFKWNGSAYVKVEDVGVGVSDYALAGMTAAAGYFLAPAISGALGAPASAATSAGATGGGITAGGIASSAAGNVLSQAIIQGAVNGEVDTSTLGQAALAGGLDYIGNAIKAQGLAAAGGDVGAAVDNAIWDMADKLGTDYDTVFNIGSDIATGVIQGDDVEDIALNALQTYTTSEVQNLVRTTFADSMGNVDVDNVFREGQTSIPIAALNPLIETAVGGAFGEDVNAEDVLDSVYEGLTYSDPFSVDADMTLRFLDPGIDLPEFETDPDLFGSTPQLIKEIEDAARYIGRETEDVVRAGGQAIAPIVEPPAQVIGDVLAEAEDVVRAGGRVVDEAVVQPTREFVKDVEDVIKEAAPQGTTPEFVEVGIDFPSVNTPDINFPSVGLPSVDLPSLGMPQFAGGGGMFDPLQYNVDYNPVQLQQMITSAYGAQPALKDYEQALAGLETRNLGMLS